MSETKTISIRDFPSDTWRYAKGIAALRGITVRDLIIQLIDQEAQKKWKKEVKK